MNERWTEATVHAAMARALQSVPELRPVVGVAGHLRCVGPSTLRALVFDAMCALAADLGLPAAARADVPTPKGAASPGAPVAADAGAVDPAPEYVEVMAAHVGIGEDSVTVEASRIATAIAILSGDPIDTACLQVSIRYERMGASELLQLPEWQ